MKVKIQSVKFTADQKLIEFIEKKIEKLTRKADDIISAEVILKLDKDREIGNKIATIILEIKGDKLIAERQKKTFEEAVSLGSDALKRQLEKRKEKHL